jgi:class I fructose-bisphosphate aldolase
MGYKAVGELNGAYGKTHKLVDEKLTTDNPIDLARYQVMNCYLGRAGLINSGGASSGETDLQEAVKTAVDQQARRRHGPHLGPQGVPAPDGRGHRAAPRDPGRLPLPEVTIA